MEEQMDEREAFQRMQRLRLGGDTPRYANLGRYYEPFEECVAPISYAALETACLPIRPSTPASAPFEIEVPMSNIVRPSEFLDIEEDIGSTRAVQPSLVFCPRSNSPVPTPHCSAIPPPRLGMKTATLVELEVTQVGSPQEDDVCLIDSAEDTGEYTDDSEGECGYTDEDEEYVAPGPSNRKGKKSIRGAQERAGMPRRRNKARIVAGEDEFPHPPIPNPGDACEQAEYRIGKQRWWSDRVLRPLLSASPKPLSKDAILSIIKKDLRLEGDAWKVFYDEHLVSTFTLRIS
jgi:hypothetical protein